MDVRCDRTHWILYFDATVWCSFSMELLIMDLVGPFLILAKLRFILVDLTFFLDIAL